MAYDCISSAKASGVHVFDETYFFSFGLAQWYINLFSASC